jgi:hypothetical protein
MQDAQAQAPRTFTYQGQLLVNGNPETGVAEHTITLHFYTDGTPGATPIASVSAGKIQVINGIFNIEVGQAQGGLPPALTFNQQYFIGVEVDGTMMTEKTRLHSVPYALNSNAVNGIGASTTAQPGMLYPLNAQGKIDPSVLPDATTGVTTINNVAPTATGNFNFVAGPGVTLTQDAPSSTITISSGSGAGIEKIVVGDGLIGGGTANSSGEVFISLAPNAVDANMIGNGVITGMKLNALIAGEGLYQDILGNLNVGVDNQSLEINADVLRIKALGVGTTQLADGAVTTVKIADGAVTAAKVDPSQVQLRVTGQAPAGSFITGVNQNGTVNSGTVNVNSTLTRAINGSNLDLGINLANPNTWTGAQTFNGGATASTLNVTGATTTNGITNTGNIGTTTLSTTGNATVGGNLAVTGTTTLTGATTSNGLTNNGLLTTTTSNTTGNSTVGGTLTVTGATTTNGITNNGNVGTTTLSTTGAATVGTTLGVGGAITAASGGHLFGTTGTDQTVLTIRGVVGGGQTELQVQGDASITGTTTLTNVNATTVTATTVNTQNLGGNGGNITLTSDVNATGRTINNGTYAGYTLNNGTLALGSTLTNNGTILGGQVNGATLNNYTLNTGSIAVGNTLSNNGTITGGNITNATVTGGTINNTIIGNTTPAAGTFTTLNSTGLAILQQLQINTTSQFNGLSAFGQNPPTNGNKVVINGIVTPTPIGNSADYELVVNGDAQITGSLWVDNFSSNILSAPLIKFDNAQPFTPGGDMTFGLGNVNFDGAGLVGDVVNIYNVPGGAHGLHVTAQAGTSGVKITGLPGSLSGLDIDPFATGINVDATAIGINIINAPISVQATGLITTTGNLNADGTATIGAGDMVTIGTNAGTNEISAADGTLNTPSSLNVNNNFNVAAASGNTTTNGTIDAAGTGTFGGGAGNTVVLGTSGANEIAAADGTVNTLGNLDAEGTLQIGNAGQFNVSATGAVTTTSTVDAEGTVTAGASNMIVIGTNAATNEISAADGTINTPSNWAFGGGVTIAGNLDVDGTGTFGGGASNFIVLGTSAANEIDAADGTINTLDNIATTGNIDAEGTVTAGPLNNTVIGTGPANEISANDGVVNTPGAFDAEGTVTAGAANNTVIGTGAANDIAGADGIVNTPNAVDAEGTGTFGAGNNTVVGTGAANDIVGADGIVNTPNAVDAEGTVTAGAGNNTVIGTGAANDIVGADGIVNTPNAVDAEGTVTAGAGNNTVIGTGAANDIVGADGVVNTPNAIDAEGTVTAGAGNNTVIGTGAANDISAADGIVHTPLAFDAGTTVTAGAADMIVIGTAVTNEVDAADGTINTLDNIDAEGTVTAGAGNNTVIGTGAANDIAAADGIVNTPAAFDAEGTVTAGAANMVVIGTNAGTNEISAADGTLNIPSAVNVNNSITNSGNINLATNAGSTSAIGNVAGFGDISLGNVGAGLGNININSSVGGDIKLNNVDAQLVPTRWVTLEAITNNVRVTDISGTANEGVSWDLVQGRYELGAENITGVPFANNRNVNMSNNSLTFTRTPAGTEKALVLNGGVAGAVAVQPTSGNLALGNDNGVNTINGRTIADGSGMTPAGDVITINNVPNTFDGLQIDAGQGASAGARINTTGTANGNGLNISTTNTGATNTGIAVAVSGGTTSNFGQTISVNGTAATGLAINANNAVGSTGETITGAVNGVNVTLPDATNGAAYIANLDAGDNQTGLRVDMNGGGGSAAGVSISEIGGGTGAVVDMTGASGATGINVLAVGTNTGISVNNVTGGGVGISSIYNDAGAGSAIQAQTTSSNTTSEAIRATGVAGGGAAIDVAAGGVDATAAAGARFADSQSAAAVVGTFNPLVINNTVARANSTIVVTYKNTSGGAFTVGQLYVFQQANGSFTVVKTTMWDAGDVVDYIVINHGS